VDEHAPDRPSPINPREGNDDNHAHRARWQYGDKYIDVGAATGIQEYGCGHTYGILISRLSLEGRSHESRSADGFGSRSQIQKADNRLSCHVQVIA
jgi:hypothetical protein